MTYTIFVKKAGKSFDVDFDKLPEHVKAHIIEYGLKQKFNDVHSAESDGTKAFGLTQNLLERLQAGELTKARNSGSPVDREVDSLLVQVARAKVGGKLADLKAMEREELLAALSKALGKSPVAILAHFTTKAEALVAKRAEEHAELLADLSID